MDFRLGMIGLLMIWVLVIQMDMGLSVMAQLVKEPTLKPMSWESSAQIVWHAYFFSKYWCQKKMSKYGSVILLLKLKDLWFDSLKVWYPSET